MKSIQYQIVEQKRPSVIALHGQKIYDYYDWLKNESDRKNRILKNEKNTLEKYLELNSQKNDWTEVRRRLHSPIDYELYSNVQYVNGNIFFSYRNFSKPIFKRVKSMKKDEQSHVVFDSNKFEHGSVVNQIFSPNGKFCAFIISEGDSLRVIVIDVEKSETLGNSLPLFSFKKIAWSADSEGFFIYYDPEGKKRRNLHYHYLDENKNDKLIAKIRKSESHTVSFRVSNDNKYLILRNSRMLSIANIESLEEQIKFKIIFEIFDGKLYEYIGNDGDFFLFLTNVRAPKHYLIEVDITNKKPGDQFDVIVKENLDDCGLLKTAFKYRGYLFLVYTENMQSSMYLYSLSNQRIEYKVNLTDENIISYNIDKYGIFFETQSFTTPSKVYRIEINQLVYHQPHEMKYSIIEPILWKESKIENFDEMQIEIQYKFYYSFDGTKIPITMIQKSGKFAPKKPCLVYADSILPKFDIFILLFIELFNGVVVIIHTRGDCELGDEWLLDTTEAEKSFSDLIEGVEYLKKESCITNIDSDKIAFYGISHSGLAGAVVLNIQRNLFKTVIFQNGNMDLMSDLANKSPSLTKRYGSLDKKEEFDCIIKYAPLLNFQTPSKTEECYPITLIVASRQDEEVPFTNSLKYLAHRREKGVNNEFQRDQPILLKVINSGGHCYRTAIKKEYIDTVFIKLQFLAETMNLKCAPKYDTNHFVVNDVQIINPGPLIKYQIIEQRGPKVIALHREKIYDYYNWLKDKSERNDILEAEAETIVEYLKLNTQKNDWPKIKEIFHNPIDYELYSNVQYVNDSLCFSYMDFSKSIYKPIFKQAKSLELVGNVHVVFDSNKVSGAVIEHEYSPSGEYCAFILALDNKKSYKCIVINVKTGKTLGNELQLFNCKKVAWSGDSCGFFVYYDPEGKERGNLFYHYLNEQIEDKFIAKIRKLEAHTVSFKVTNDYNYLMLCDSRTVSIANIKSLAGEIRFDLIFKISRDINYEYIGNDLEVFTFLTNFGAPKHHLVDINIRSKKSGNHWDVAVPENLDGHGLLKSALKYRNYLFLVYIENVQSSLYLYSLIKHQIEYKIDLENEKFLSIKLDRYGFFFETQTFQTPRKVYRIDLSQLVFRLPLTATYYTTLKPKLWKETKVPNLDIARFSVQHDSYQSFDKTKVPMTIIQKDGTYDQKRPCLVFSYGAFGISMLPTFKLFFLLFIELFNGVICIIHSRGGGELGDQWLLKSTEAETSFNDLIAGIECLKSESYAKIIDSNKIAYYGVSHGGLAGAVVVNKKRDLFQAVIFQNANFDLIGDLPNKGRIWAKQYGNLTNKVDFDSIKKYAPLLHIQKSTNSKESYPSTLLVASQNDETVSIANSIKYLSHRRENAGDSEFQRNKPILFKVINSGGHHYETAKKLEFIDAVFVKLEFLAESLELQFDKKYREKDEQAQNPHNYDIYY